MESMVAKLQELIDRKPQALSIFLVNRFGIEESPTPLVLLGLYQLYGESFLEDLSIIFEGQDDLVAFSGIYGTLNLSADIARQQAAEAEAKAKEAKRDNTIKAVSSAVNFVKDVFKSSKSSSGNTAGAPPPPEDQSADKTKKIIIIGAIVIVVLIVVVIVVKKFKK